MRPRGDPKEVEHRRLEALRMLRAGNSQQNVARMLGVDRISVYRWAKAGQRGVKARPNTGRPPKLNAKQKRELERVLLKGALAAGFPTDLWTCPRIRDVIRKKFGINYHVDHLGRVLRALGWSPQKPQRRAIERDEDAIRTWVKTEWPRIKKTKRLGALLAFIDESGLMMAPFVRRTWAPVGKTPVLWQRGRHRSKVSIIAAVVMKPSGDPRGLFFRLHVDKNIARSEVTAFLRQLRRHCRQPIVVVWDRLNAHKSPQVRVYAAAHDIHLELLPAYAPELNPAEYVWAYLKTNPMANFTPVTVEQLARTSRCAGRRLQRRGNLLRSFAAQSPLFF